MKAMRIFLTVIFIMAMSFGVNAQDKYDYATVIFVNINKKCVVAVSTKGKYEEHEFGALDNGKWGLNLTPAIEEIGKMNEQGWEVYANNTIGELPHKYIYHLRKKKS